MSTLNNDISINLLADIDNAVNAAVSKTTKVTVMQTRNEVEDALRLGVIPEARQSELLDYALECARVSYKCICIILANFGW